MGAKCTGQAIRDRILKFILTDDEYERLYGSLRDTCRAAVASSPVEELMVRMTDIHEHITTLYLLTVELGLTEILELGTRDGESTVALLYAAVATGGHVTSVDIAPCLKARERIRTLGLESRWTFIHANDLHVDWSKRIDHLFVDTSHKYKQTLEELKKYEPHVKDGGLITMHDTVSYPDTLRALRDYATGREDLRLYEYFNCNGLAIVLKGRKRNQGN